MTDATIEERPAPPTGASPDKREAILAAALRLLARLGLHNTPMSAVAREAGVAAGTLYLYFPSKEAVFKALVQEMIGPQLARLAGLARGHEGPIGPLLAAMLRNLGQFIATSDKVVLPKMVIAEAGNFPDLARIYREEVIERGLGLFGNLLQSGISRGEIREMPIPHAVRLCLAPLLLAAIWRTTFARFDAAAYDYEGLIEAHVTTLLRGLAREGQVP